MNSEQQKYYYEELARIRSGGYNHDASMQDHVWGMGSYNLGEINPPVVAFGQDGDPFYTQYLRNWDEVNALINNLKEEAIKAWGENNG